MTLLPVLSHPFLCRWILAEAKISPIILAPGPYFSVLRSVTAWPPICCSYHNLARLLYFAMQSAFHSAQAVLHSSGRDFL